MKAGNFLTQRTFSAKDTKNIELRKLRRKNIGEIPTSRPSDSKDATRAITHRENSFLHKHKASDGQLAIFKAS